MTKAHDALILEHLPMARALAVRYRTRGQPVDDLFQIASLGLVKAARRWEPERGLAFSSYAVPTIVGELRRYFRDMTWDIRPPRRLQELSLAVVAARAQLECVLQREPTVAELAARLDRPADEVAEALSAGQARRLPPLEDGVGGAQVDDGYERAEQRATIQRLTTILDDRSREILRLRFVHDLPQSEIAARTGLSQVGVSRLLRVTLERLSARAGCGGAVQPMPG